MCCQCEACPPLKLINNRPQQHAAGFAEQSQRQAASTSHSRMTCNKKSPRDACKSSSLMRSPGEGCIIRAALILIFEVACRQ